MRRTTVAVAAIMAATLVVPGAASAETPSSALSSVPGEVDGKALGPDSRGVVVATGLLADKAGRGRAGRVAALVWPNEATLRKLQLGDVVATPTVGWARADARGRFSIEVDPTLVPPTHLGSGGLINLTLLGWDGATQGEWGMSARLPRPRQDRMASHAGEARPTPQVVLRSNQPFHSRAGRTVSAAAEDAGVAPAVVCYEYFVSSHDVYDVVGETWPYGSHKGGFKISSGHDVTMGTAISVSGSFGSWSVSGSSTVDNAVTDDFGLSPAYRDYRMQTRYGKYNGPCGGFRIRPMYATGGFSTVGLSGVPSLSSCASAFGTWTRSSSSGKQYTASTGVKITAVIGINLSSTTNYSTTRTMTYNHPTAYRVCGSDDVPSRASKVKTAP